MNQITKLQFGLVLPTRESVTFGTGDPQPLLRQAERAEAWKARMKLASASFTSDSGDLVCTCVELVELSAPGFSMCKSRAFCNTVSG